MNLKWLFALLVADCMHLARSTAEFQRKFGNITLAFGNNTSFILPCPSDMNPELVYGDRISFIGPSSNPTGPDEDRSDYHIDLTVPSVEDCSGSLNHPVQLYINVRSLQLGCSETFYLTAPNSTGDNSVWIRKNFTHETESITEGRRESFGQYFLPSTHSSVMRVGLEHNTAHNFCTKTTSESILDDDSVLEPTLIQVVFSYLHASSLSNFPEGEFCICPALTLQQFDIVYVPTSLLCKDFISCPKDFDRWSDKPDPSLEANFRCNSAGEPQKLVTTTTGPVVSSTAIAYYTTRRYTWDWSTTRWPWSLGTPGPAPTSPTGDALMYVAISFSMLTIMILISFGAYIFLKERKNRMLAENAPHIWSVGEVNQAMEMDPSDPPPPYRPPGAPPSYGESQEGNTEVVLDMEEEYCDDPDRIFFRLPDFSEELSQTTPDVVADVPDSTT